MDVGWDETDLNPAAVAERGDVLADRLELVRRLQGARKLPAEERRRVVHDLECLRWVVLTLSQAKLNSLRV